MIEVLLAVPLLLLLGLGIAQLTLVYQAKHALDYAVMQAARQGAVDHASPDAIRRGLAAGLVPYLYGASDWAGLLAAEAGAQSHLAQGSAAGWILLRQRSPLQESFVDWAEPAIDEFGRPIAGQIEIPNDNLDNRRTRAQPRSGTSGHQVSEPIGRLSGQTLADANLLRLELVYGVRLVVPIVGRLLIRTLAAWHRCTSAPASSAGVGDGLAGAAGPANGRLGLLLLGGAGGAAANPGWMCRFYESDGDASGAGRIPLRVSATVRMMSTARYPDAAHAREDFASGESVGAQREEQGPADTTTQRSQGSEGGSGAIDNGGGGRRSTPAGSGSGAPRTSLANGFLGIGSDRPYPQPQVHPAVCAG